MYMEPQLYPMLQYLIKAKGLRGFQKARRASDPSAGVGGSCPEPSASAASPHPTRELGGSL